MKIRMPNLLGEEKYIEDKTSVVLIGANGAGKTRMSVWIDENNPELNTHRISAQKSLSMPEMVSPTEMSMAEEILYYGMTYEDKAWLKRYGKKSSRWGDKPETYMLNDFEQLMVFLMTENYEKSIEFREKHKQGDEHFDNETKLEKVKAIWEDVITHRNLKICAGKIEVMDAEIENSYNGSEMSDGERAIFHFIGEVLSVKEDSLIIIDEPENHLHSAILTRLWDAIERARADCTFLYITHDFNFAVSRVNSQLVWVKNMPRFAEWDYELIEDPASTDKLALEIMGSRQKVLLIEGTKDKSVDCKLYEKLFKDYNVIPLEGCQTVIQATRAYHKTAHLNYVDVTGLVDRDRRSDEEISALASDNIFVLGVAEVENLFMLPDVIRILAEKLNKENGEEIVDAVKERTFEFLQNNIDQQALLFVRQSCENQVYKELNEASDSIDKYIMCVNDLLSHLDIRKFYDECRGMLQRIINEKDYMEALRVINHKGLLSSTHLPGAFGWKKDYYIEQVLLFLDAKDSGPGLREAMLKYVQLR